MLIELSASHMLSVRMQSKYLIKMKKKEFIAFGNFRNFLPFMIFYYVVLCSLISANIHGFSVSAENDSKIVRITRNVHQNEPDKGTICENGKVSKKEPDTFSWKKKLFFQIGAVQVWSRCKSAKIA